jgi:hypothetical protein
VESQLLKGHDYATATIVLAIRFDAAADDGIVWRVPPADGTAETHGA